MSSTYQPSAVDAVCSFSPASSTYGSPKPFDDVYFQMDDGDEQHPRIEHDLSPGGSVMTAEGLADPEGFWIVCSVVLVGDMTRGVAFPIMWPLVEELGGNSIWLGYVVSAFSFGRFIASPCMGKWSVEIGYTETLVASTTILLVGCVSFAQVYSVGNMYFLVFSQIVLGIGSATLGVTRAYVAEITATRQRTTYIALLTAVQYGAFTGTLIYATRSLSWAFFIHSLHYFHVKIAVTPIFGSIFSHFLEDKRYEVG
jgi:MFS family permease